VHQREAALVGQPERRPDQVALDQHDLGAERPGRVDLPGHRGGRHAHDDRDADLTAHVGHRGGVVAGGEGKQPGGQPLRRHAEHRVEDAPHLEAAGRLVEFALDPHVSAEAAAQRGRRA
jgi:hypothetical protein